MNRDDIARMAREAGAYEPTNENDWAFELVDLERFAALVAAHERDLVVAAEREECAQTIERARLRLGGEHGLTNETDHIATRIVDFLAAAVRERGYDHLGELTTFRAAAQMQRRIDELKAAAAVRERGEQE